MGLEWPEKKHGVRKPKKCVSGKRERTIVSKVHGEMLIQKSEGGTLDLTTGRLPMILVKALLIMQKL